MPVIKIDDNTLEITEQAVYTVKRDDLLKNKAGYEKRIPEMQAETIQINDWLTNFTGEK